MSITVPILDRTDPTKNYDRHLWRSDKVLQSAELTESVTLTHARMRAIFDVLLKDGDILGGAQLVVNAETGAATAEAGQVYLAGASRNVLQAALQIAVVGIVNVGIYLVTDQVSEVDDPALLNPAAGTRGYGEPGALRLRITPTWGYAGDGKPGEFYPVWVVEDGYVRAKEPPPNLDAVTQALARYDRDSAGGLYIVDGMVVSMAADLPNGNQVYTVSEGNAHVNGYNIGQAASRRLVYPATPDVRRIDSEPHLSAGEATQRIDLDRWPIRGVPEVRITSRRTVTVVHGGFAGAADALPDTSILAIETVKQAGVNYAAPADYKLTAGQVDWSPNGAEPAPGSSYDVTYQYVRLVVPTDIDSRGFKVTGALANSNVLVTYDFKLRRIDRLCLDQAGGFSWLQGVSADWSPVAPTVPAGTLALATVYQSWDGDRRLVQDGVRTVSMDELVTQRTDIDAVRLELAELRLAVDIAGRDSGIKLGQFADPMMSDAMRDAGIAQTAAVVGGALRLPIAVQVHQLGAAITSRQAPAHAYSVALAQLARTGTMLVNPYMAFRPLPATVLLTPSVDRWTQVTTQWASAVTERLYVGNGSALSYGYTISGTQTLSEVSTNIETLRQIPVRFDLGKFGPGEGLVQVLFDGISVVPQPLPNSTLLANPGGVLSGTFTIPAGVSAGVKEVVFRGSGGSEGTQFFTGQGTAVLRTQRTVSTQVWAYSQPATPAGGGVAVVGPSGGSASNSSAPSGSTACIGPSTDPLAQTFTLVADGQLAGVDLWFTAKSTEVVVQIRETQVGFPTQKVLIERRVQPGEITVGQATRITWAPVQLAGGQEYALVVLCDDAVTELAIATVKDWDPINLRYVSVQPFQVGVLLSSSDQNTWTAHQYSDLAFRLLAPTYTQAERIVELGEATLDHATDLMVLGYFERPSTEADAVFELEFADGTLMRLNDGQVVWLAAPYTGVVKARARLKASTVAGAVLQPGVQLIAGTIAASGTYVSRAFKAGANSKVKVVYDGELPAGSSVVIEAQSTAANAAWVPVPYLSASAQTAGVREITHRLDAISADAVRLRISLTGGTAARPAVRNLRAVAL